jgi:uroporphyrin-III C-methyltransferase
MKRGSRSGTSGPRALKPRKPSDRSRPGVVYLVGAGPGAPDLVTLRGLALLRRADAVVHDELVDRRLLGVAPPGALRLDAGKARGRRTLSQGAIQRRMLALARRGLTVVRLKGGDPYLFGRGAEEREFLEGRGVRCAVVPGVTSALAVPGAAGIPLTHRDFASMAAIVTGHEGDRKGGLPVDWDLLARWPGTLVVLMGVRNLGDYTRRLREGGMAPETPAAVVEEGTTEGQRATRGTLATLAARARRRRVRSPAVVVIGRVAAASAPRRPTPSGGRRSRLPRRA